MRAPEEAALQHSLIGYAFQMGLRPQTLYALADSPVGLAAYLIDHDSRSYELIKRAFDGQEGGLTHDDVLDNITLFWFTNTAVSAGAPNAFHSTRRYRVVRMARPRIARPARRRGYTGRMWSFGAVEGSRRTGTRL